MNFIQQGNDFSFCQGLQLACQEFWMNQFGSESDPDIESEPELNYASNNHSEYLKCRQVPAFQTFKDIQAPSLILDFSEMRVTNLYTCEYCKYLPKYSGLAVPRGLLHYFNEALQVCPAEKPILHLYINLADRYSIDVYTPWVKFV